MASTLLHQNADAAHPFLKPFVLSANVDSALCVLVSDFDGRMVVRIELQPNGETATAVAKSAGCVSIQRVLSQEVNRTSAALISSVATAQLQEWKAAFSLCSHARC